MVWCLSSTILLDLSSGSGPCSQPPPYLCPSTALEGAGWRSPEQSQRVSQQLIRADNHAASAQTHSWPSCIWQIGIAFYSSSNEAPGVMWFVSAALILKISLIT